MDKEVTDLLADLVRIRSVNPMGGDASREGYNEMGVVDYVARHLRRIGLEPEIHEVAPHRANVSALTPGGARDPVILFEAHMDTVPADTWPGNAWEPVIRDGCLHGRGACDTKGALSAMLAALRRFLALGRSRQRVQFLAVCDEESGLGGALAWARLGRPARFGVVGEPTRLEIVHAHKGAARWDVVVRGRSAHSAHRDEGVSAIARMARVVLALERHYEEDLKKRTHPLLGCATISVGTIRGGQTVNTVPDLCEASLDRRLLPGETAEQALAEIRDALRRAPAIDFDVEFNDRGRSMGGLDTPVDSPAVQRAARACDRALGGHRLGVVSYATDASVYAHAGIPCVVLGPGDIRNAHTDHEHVDLAEVEKAVGVYLAIMRGE
jgi:acetylornithine deacetylase